MKGEKYDLLSLKGEKDDLFVSRRRKNTILDDEFACICRDFSQQCELYKARLLWYQVCRLSLGIVVKCSRSGCNNQLCVHLFNTG
ncbi:hypothetical protein Hanom_Chr10g00913791 [Helianthus anomalus]